jgi:hypothetical protein
MFYIFAFFTPGKQPYFEISEMTTHPKPKTDSDPRPLHGKKRRARCSTGLNNVLLPTLFTLVNNIEQYC